jgi:hypothetical protein
MAKQINTKAGRFYEVEDEKYPSVTSILSVIGKPALINWAAKVEREMVLDVSADLYLDAPLEKMSKPAWITTMQTRLGKAKASAKELAKAAEIGSQAHSLIEWTLLSELVTAPGPEPKISAKAGYAFAAWLRWRESVNLKPLLVEQVVWSKTHRYAGTLDLLAEVNGILTVVDWKTGKAIYPEAFLQNAAYRHAIREMGHGDPKAGMIVRLPKLEGDPEFQASEAGEEESNLKIFLHAKKVWEWQQVFEEAYWEKRDEKQREASGLETQQSRKDEGVQKELLQKA